MKKYYSINGEIHQFNIVCESPLDNGDVCYYAKDSKTKEKVWLYPNGIIEYCNDRKIVHADEYKTGETIRLNPYQYRWGGEIRDKRSNSMCARPFFRR